MSPKWKKYLMIFFGTLAVLRVLFWLFGDPMPSCGSKQTLDKLASIVKPQLVQNGIYDVNVVFKNGREITTTKTTKSCEATMVASDGEDELKVIREYDIRKKFDDTYEVILYKG